MTSSRSPDRGRAGGVGAHAVLVGNAALLAAAGIDPAPAEGRAEALRAGGETVLFVAVDGQLAGVLGVADPIKDSTRRGAPPARRGRGRGP